jgi:hypothetical protein
MKVVIVIVAVNFEYNTMRITTKHQEHIGVKQIAINEGDNVKRLTHKQLDFGRSFKVLELKDGRVYVETEVTNFETGITLIEVLMRPKCRKLFCIIQRHRFGEGYDRMQSDERDNKYPLFCYVRM